MSPTYYKDMIFAPRDLCVALADGLVKKGHTVFLFTSNDISSRASIISGDMHLLELAAKSEKEAKDRVGWSLFFSKKRYYELDLTDKCFAMAKSGKLDVIHSYHDFCAHFFNDVSEVPIIYTQHDPLDVKRGYSWLLSRFHNHTYVAISDAQRHTDSFEMSFIDTVYHGISVREYAFSETKGNYGACMARLVPEKGVYDAIQAMDILKERLHIATSLKEVGLDKAYVSSSIQSHLTSEIVLVGFMEGKKKAEFLSNAFVFLFPIHWEEPFGMVMIEAMACGTPVVAYARGSVPEVVVDGVTGFIINESEKNKRGDWIIKKTGVEGLVEAINRLKVMPKEEYMTMRKACRKHVEDHFSVEQMVEGYEKVYEKILASQGQALRS
jgi:glycosyltransferase involved in cell wall biosynthesis